MRKLVACLAFCSYYNSKNYLKIHYFKKGCIIMKQLIGSAKRNVAEKERTAVLRLEMDYELATLFEAMTEKNEKKQTQVKEKLEKIRVELVRLKAL